MKLKELRKIKMHDNIKFVEDYLLWVNNNKLDPPTFSPEEYASHLRSIKNHELLQAIVEVVHSKENADKIIDAILLILQDKN
jgi:hypothetical protein